MTIYPSDKLCPFNTFSTCGESRCTWYDKEKCQCIIWTIRNKLMGGSL